jgi:hypothetical protein
MFILDFDTFTNGDVCNVFINVDTEDLLKHNNYFPPEVKFWFLMCNTDKKFRIKTHHIKLAFKFYDDAQNCKIFKCRYFLGNLNWMLNDSKSIFTLPCSVI